MSHLFLYESEYVDGLRNEVITLLTVVDEEGISQVSVNNLLYDLTKLGYAVDKEILGDVMSDIEIAEIKGDVIEINPSPLDDVEGKPQSEKRVDQLASKQAQQDLTDSVDGSIRYVTVDELKKLAGMK